MLYSQLKGLTVISEKEGELLGVVRRLIFDTSSKKLLALTFKGHRSGVERWVGMQAVGRLGKDVVFLKDESLIEDNQPAGRDIQSLVSLTVASMDGKRLGQVTDIVFDPSDWSIQALVVEGYLQAAVGREAVLGEDVIILEKGATVRALEAAERRKGFLSRVFGREVASPPESKDQK